MLWNIIKKSQKTRKLCSCLTSGVEGTTKQRPRSDCPLVVHWNCARSGWVLSHSRTDRRCEQTAERPRNFNKELAFLFEFWNDRMESVSVGWVANYDRRKTNTNQRNVFFHGWYLVTDFIEGFKHSEASAMKHILPIKFRLSVGDPPHLVDGLVWPNSWFLT